jgi:uncharacterized membrane protein
VYSEGEVETLAIVGLVVGVALAALLASALIWWIVRRVGRATGLDRKADHFLEVDGDGLSPQDRLKFREQHRTAGRRERRLLPAEGSGRRRASAVRATRSLPRGTLGLPARPA